MSFPALENDSNCLSVCPGAQVHFCLARLYSSAVSALAGINPVHFCLSRLYSSAVSALASIENPTIPYHKVGERSLAKFLRSTSSEFFSEIDVRIFLQH
jgi:hypothetical protein